MSTSNNKQQVNASLLQDLSVVFKDIHPDDVAKAIMSIRPLNPKVFENVSIDLVPRYVGKTTDHFNFSEEPLDGEIPNEDIIKQQIEFIERVMPTLKETLGLDDHDAFIIAYDQYQEHQKAQATLQVTSDSPSFSNS